MTFANLPKPAALLALAAWLILSAPLSAGAYPLFRTPSIQLPPGTSLSAYVGGLAPAGERTEIKMLDPADGALVPSDAASPILRWEDPAAPAWLISLSVDGRPVCRGIVDESSWAPDPALWARIKEGAGDRPIEVAVEGVAYGLLVSSARTSFAVSPDPAGADIAFLRKRLPFRVAKDNPFDSQMVVGDLAEHGKPRVVMQDLPICFNCHAYSQDGSTYGMDMDYKGDKGGYALMDVGEKVTVRDRDVVSWNDYPPPKPAKYSMGLFTSFSPDGRYAASTVGETSAFIMLDDLYFSQMFYPATGQIAIRDRKTGKVVPLPGADDTAYIQTNPSFTPDGARVAFARATVKPELVADIEAGRLIREDPRQNILDADEKYPMQFDLWSVPFNGGKGGSPEPIKGASANGRSNFFPRYSPDGKWLVFTQCATGLVLQPDSRLVIVPAEGGEPRPLRANTGLMNSWHSWSPNSKWLCFASKGNSPFTEIYLTHIDDNGESSPPLRLFRLSHPELAAMVPEFVPPAAGIKQKYMDLADPDGAVGQSIATDGR
ncbi:TolB family protein [Pseudodesulfovibrio indicus]|uniref:WD40 repeat protein n=1 Tax=Pseudodesulfovibrio indicus TaxID=1716143 RepID=A0A140D925_9BACT|nr:PD40 domain-containing protein [Pseudodesulfovibrio indicus]AMK09692.1 hypothetical protein AWY79_00505 [Pseudodesulfovibrio indicus]TDT86352.1 WD40 repeat protein [Pseudodesulfovibrio indicus]